MHNIVMLQNKPAFCADYQTHELYNRTSTQYHMNTFQNFPHST